MDPEKFELAVQMAAESSLKMTLKATEGQALGDGKLLELFMKLFEMLLPILLKLLGGTGA